MKLIQLFLTFFFMCFLVACSQKQYESQETQSTNNSSISHAEKANNTVTADEQLGTRWGDDISSNVTEVNLVRRSSSPIAEAQIRYADKNYRGREINSIALAAGQVSLSVIDEHQNNLPLYREGQNYYLAGRNGQSYQLHYENKSNQTFEIVASVDGLDVINGQSASRNNSGYVVYPHSSLAIEGFRKSDSAVASFTFSQPEEAYAANSSSGSIYNTGIIGTVIYELEAPRKTERSGSARYAPPPNAFPEDR